VRLVVVGASLAGLRAVEAARRAGHSGPVTLVGAEAHLPYDRPPLSKAFLSAGGPVTEPTFRTEADLRDGLDVELRLGAPAERLDPVSRSVLVSGDAVPYDVLVVATGATPRPPPWSGAETAVGGVHTLRTIGDPRAVRTALDAGARTVVVGAGFIGSEVASAARKRGLGVTLVEALDLPLTRSVGPEAGLVCAGLHRANGVDLRLGTRVSGLDGDRVTGVRLGDGTLVPADLVRARAGPRPPTGAGSGSSARSPWTGRATS
jgi:NADPH-dependent 2,4-dienoyl-CoA reductase/sulfur reductase-like enzyme